MSFVGSLGKLLPSFQLNPVEPQTRMSARVIALSRLIFKAFWRGSLSSIYMVISHKPNRASKEVVSGFLWLEMPQKRAAPITINRLCWLWHVGVRERFCIFMLVLVLRISIYMLDSMHV